MASVAQPAGPVYEDGVVRAFALAAVLWGIVGMLVGVVIAAQLAWPELNLGIPWLSYGRLRPLHTNAVIFAFGGCTLFATAYHVVQRTGQTRLFAPGLAWFTFIGMYVEVPPYIRRPTMRLAYWTGIRRCACSMKTTKPNRAMITTTAARA